MRDPVVIESLRRRGVNLGDIDEVLRYEAVELKPRILDAAPKRISLSKSKDIMSYGCLSELVIHYKEQTDICSIDMGTIVFPNGTYSVDRDVYCLLQALICLSVTKIRDRAMACLDIFKLITTCGRSVITAGVVYELLSNFKTDDYYTQEIIKGIRVCLFNTKTSVLYWDTLCDSLGFYKEAIRLGCEVIERECATESDVQKFLKPLYAEAKADKEFMSNIYKPGANKWLIAMLWYLKDTHPEALNPNTSNNCFS